MENTLGQLEQLIAEGQALAEKRIGVRKSYQGLLEKLNEYLKGIPDMEEAPLRYTIYEWEARNEHGDKVEHEAELELHFLEDAWIRLAHNTNDGGWGWERSGWSNPSLPAMRAVGEKLGEALEYFLEQVQGRNTDHDQAIATLTELTQKLQ